MAAVTTPGKTDLNPQIEQFQRVELKTAGELHPVILADRATPD
jgi:hypothetical protein